ncbi:MAG: hypothetical protein HWN80_13535 [Candidatus Lokiarchaeota archaeon]|nr:hypothetical protein [Candidatus Lokiarchaeota archaeon]
MAYIIILLGYYGLVVNIVMVDEWISLTEQTWISFTEMDRTVLFWTYEAYVDTFFLPLILLFIVCFILTYKEDIPHYGIRASIWLVPTIILEGFIFYFFMFGFSLEPFILQFGHFEGYLNILFLIGLTLSGSLLGMKIKQFSLRKKEKY